MTIRRMTLNELNFALKLAVDEGWISETEEMFKAFFEHDPDGCFMLFTKDQPAGICIATGYAQAGFIGELIVHKDHRGQGFGKALLQAGMDYLQSRNYKAIYLDAVPDAVPLYEIFGFQKLCRSLRFHGSPDAACSSINIRSMHREDLDAVSRLDEIRFGQNRRFFLEWKFSMAPQFGKVLEEGHQIRGYIIGRPILSGINVGPWVVDESVKNPEDLIHGLAKEAPDMLLNLGVLESNGQAVNLLTSMGFRKKTPHPPWRMVFGNDFKVGFSSQCFAIGSPAKG